MSLQSTNGICLGAENIGGSAAIVFPVCTNPLLRLGLENILSEAGFVVWHDILDGFSSLPSIDDEVPALFIIDGSSFASGAIDLVRRLKAHAPAARIVILADAFDPDTVSAAWDAGVHGLCLSTHKQDVLIKSLELVMLGEPVLPATVVLPIAGIGARNTHHEAAGDSNETKFNGHPNRRLSNRESEILTCLKDGAPNKVIARKLNLSEATVKVHVKTILKKIGARNRTQAALWAAKYVSADLDPL
jgi:two-component system nitrate/nitrite response regulator NarL